MLEHHALLVQSRTSAAVQTILDGDGGLALGFAHWPPQAPRAWWPSFGHCLVEVHEQEDEPLLFTVHRAWSLLPRREVRDADGHPVGSLLGRLIQDALGRTIAAWQDGVFRNPYQRILADLAPSSGGMRLSFADDLNGEPFVKMLLLAATLVNVDVRMQNAE
jgi:hypothetical protein